MSTISLASDEVAAAIAVVSQVDLAPINLKLRHEDPSFWTDELIAETELNYRRFLALNVLYPDTSLSVNKALDEYWHQHILDTRKYAADCDMVFGRFLHHYPYFGLDDEAEWQQNVDQFAFTQQLWEGAFGVSLVDQPKLTLDKVLGPYQDQPEHISTTQIYAFPQACKCGQHCQKIIGPDRINPEIKPLPQEPFTPIKR